MTKTRIILGYLFGFILSLIIALIVLLLIIKFSIFNPKYIKRELDKVNYYSSIHEEIINGMKDFMAPTGLSDTIIDGVVSEEEAKTEINNFIDAIIVGQNYEVNTSKIEDRVRKNLNDYLTKHNVKMDETEEFSVFIHDLENVYSNEVKLYKVLDKYVGFYPKISKYLTRGLMLLCVIMAILIIILIVIRPRIVSSSIMSGGIILVLSRIFIIEDIDIKNISLFNEYFSLVIRDILKYISDNTLFIGTCLLALGLVISMFYSKKKRNLKK